MSTPTLIPFQGRITDQAGQAYTKGQYTIVFTLYDLAVGGSVLWTETHERVGVVNGMVNVFLGSINSLDNVSFAETRHLGITIDADNNPNTPDPEMVPRQMIIPAFWAKHSDNSSKLAGHDWATILADGATNPATGRLNGTKLSDGSVRSVQIASGQIKTANIEDGAVTSTKLAAGVIGTGALADGAVTSQKILDGTILTNDLAASLLRYLSPPGTIVAFGGNNVPDGWELCDGRLLLRSGKYASLFAAIGTAWGTESVNDFRLPDLRGYFLRGRADGQAADPDRNSRIARFPGGASSDNVGSYQADELRSHTHTFITGGGSSGPRNAVSWDTRNEWNTTTSATGGNETRAKNAYVNYIMKY